MDDEHGPRKAVGASLRFSPMNEIVQAHSEERACSKAEIRAGVAEERHEGPDDDRADARPRIAPDEKRRAGQPHFGRLGHLDADGLQR